MSARDFDPKSPLYYDQFFGFSEEVTDYEAELQDDVYGEQIGIYGHRIDVFLCTYYEPIPVFGEDPVKRYEASPFVAKAVFDPTAEVLQIGEFEKNTDQELITLYMHKTTVKESIKSTLLDGGFIDASADTIEDTRWLTKYEKHRRELQEGDIIRLHFNNIFYEIDGIKEEPDYQHHLYKYVYEVYARPRLVSGEYLGTMQPVTEAEEIQETHSNELKNEADKILF